MSSNDVAISVSNLTKSYRLFAHPGDRIKQVLCFGARRYYRKFSALQHFSLDIQKGETVGIIGRNGSGKSTLLQIICGILKPTSGTIRVNGTIAALLELGAGFNPEFTGRENVYFQGILMGISREQMDRLLEEIILFAGIGEFIDQPVRTYSSGMFVRLAFAVSVSTNPDVLVVDEALAVGDPGYRARCFRRIGELRQSGCTVLFVSHDMDQVRALCNRVVLLEHGQQLFVGDPEAGISEMQRLTRQDTRSCIVDIHQIGSAPDHADRPRMDLRQARSERERIPSDHAVPYESNGALIHKVQIFDDSGRPAGRLKTGNKYKCRFTVDLMEDLFLSYCTFLIKTVDGIRLGGAKAHAFPERAVMQMKEGSSIDVAFDFQCKLNAGSYLFSVAAFGVVGNVPYAIHGIQNALKLDVENEKPDESLGIVDFEIEPSMRINRINAV